MENRDTRVCKKCLVVRIIIYAYIRIDYFGSSTSSENEYVAKNVCPMGDGSDDDIVVVAPPLAWRTVGFSFALDHNVVNDLEPCVARTSSWPVLA